VKRPYQVQIPPERVETKVLVTPEKTVTKTLETGHFKKVKVWVADPVSSGGNSGSDGDSGNTTSENTSGNNKYLELTEEMNKTGVEIIEIYGVEYYDYSKPINNVFQKAAEEAKQHKRDLKWFKSKVNHGADWDIKVSDSWNRTIGKTYPGKPTTWIVVNGELTSPEKLGNMMYGYTGTAAKIPEAILIAGAVYAAGTAYGVDFLTDEKLRENELEDHETIKKGVNWYKEEN
jgi:hypothetical protein